MEVKAEESEQSKFQAKQNQTGIPFPHRPSRPVEKPVCTAPPLCEGCPFPGHGFLCRGEDGECMRTRMELDMGKLAVWRLATHSTFGGTWLSDYVPNRLGGFVQVQETKAEPERIKPDCSLIGTDGNIFHLIGKASETLRKNGMQEQAEEMRNRIFRCQSYGSQGENQWADHRRGIGGDRQASEFCHDTGRYQLKSGGAGSGV